MNNFKSAVPAKIQNKIKALVDSAKISDLFRPYYFEAISEQDSADIEGNGKDGWIPRQDGGFEVNQLYANEPGYSPFTEKQKDYTSEQEKSCYASFCSDNDIELGDGLTDDEQEQYNNYENEWFLPCLIQLQVFCNGYSYYRNDEKSITIRLSVNYKDAPYYREKYAEDLGALVLDEQEFLQTDNENILQTISENYKQSHNS